MIRKFLLYISFLLVVFAIDGCFRHKTDKYTSMKYQESKNRFDIKYTNFFPESISSIETERLKIVTDRNTPKNNYILMLYEYGVSTASIDSAKSMARKLAKARYSASDSCLLIVNKFETKESSQSIEPITLRDSSHIEMTCYEGKLPVPNFVDSGLDKRKNSLFLDGSFDIYVFEAVSIPFWGEQYNGMGPNPQMPKKWKNGYSKGMAINSNEKTIIYWLAIW